MGVSAVVSTEKLNLCAGKYVGKDDPVCVVRCQSGFPAVGEVLQPYMHPYMVAGWMRGSHIGAWYPCSVDDSDPVYFDGPPRVCALGFQISHGKLQGMEDPGQPVGVHSPVDFFSGKLLGYGPPEGHQGQHIPAAAGTVHARHPGTGRDGVHHPPGRPQQAEGQDGGH